ncbi:hypothetical protein ZEAMMB73_Zm00001d014624 [Zea mays]|uniref:Transposase Tnp1/En/Spm-like domain-containing protein n=1 Tax=Zea mays TaxID=4577 RepID=A0A1D6GUL9_MAIZE|nr:hypothetical protein ZEAMMB73_Zm00001d014624 [Zea mays]
MDTRDHVAVKVLDKAKIHKNKLAEQEWRDKALAQIPLLHSSTCFLRRLLISTERFFLWLELRQGYRNWSSTQAPEDAMEFTGVVDGVEDMDNRDDSRSNITTAGGGLRPLEMPRGRRKQTIESNEEYLSEDHVGQTKSQKTLAHESDSEMEEESFAVGGHQSGEVSEMEPNSKNPTDMDADIEVEDEEKNVEVKRRGKTKLLQVWNIPRGHRIVVNYNELDQPIGEEAGITGKFLGMVARNGNLCSLSYKDWRLLIGKKERLSNEQKNKEDILKQVKRRFLYPARMEKWVLKTIGERWRQHKSNLKSIYYDAHNGLEANYNNVPHGVIADQWIALVNHWVTTKAKNDLKELLAEHPEFADTSQGKIAWNGDALNKILGEEKPGHVHGLGLVPNPNKVLDGTTSRRLNQLHVTSLDPTASEDVVSLKLQMEKLVNHGCLDDLPANQFQTSSKRKRVYVEPQNQEFRMDNEKSYSQTRQFEMERDITFDNTKLANSSKSMTKEATSNSLNEEASKNQVKRKDMQSATTFDKTKCATTSKTGAQVFLKSWRCPTKTVALGTVLGRDPNHKVGGVKLGREFWMVRVRLVILPIEPLIRPYDNMEVIGDVGNNLIAWPSCCV